MNISEIGPALGAGFAFWRRAFPRVWGALLLLTVISLAGVAEAANGVSAGWVLLTSVAELAATVVACGALFRLALSSESDRASPPGPVGLQWTRVEWRIAGAYALTFFLILLIALAVVFVILLLIAILYIGMGAGAVPAKGFLASPAGQATLWLGATGGLLLLWVLVRLSLSVPATVDRGTVQVFSTWPLTRGRTLALLAIAILLGMPIFLRLGLPMLIPDGIAQILDDGAASVALRCLACLLGGLVQLPILAGALSFIYRRAAGTEVAT